MNPTYEIIDHTADVGLRVRGESGNALFESAALGMSAILYGGRLPEETTEKLRLKVEAENLEELLLIWLREILYCTERNSTLYTAFQIEDSNLSSESIDKYFINASLRGTKTADTGHGICTEIKAVTRHGLKLNKGRVWEANILFDV